ncbi:Mur ligase family protein [Candidatus Comchoanobacter bicostacola]|uniref:Mur ligase family protein n=1 Tax=Candidatus Comchoanobacter bicostacola TaxID=2919598 RepID=A0ABY5DLX4_9GAMM|nr:cyanophycin synthetase [Candidatus Comchoanobacter bicostacola]UTC24761.1 Mur ligase family protein [Candidatus Comchoanobacter bicostacola]
MNMRLFVIGVCGTLMSGVARLGVDLGFEVIGIDQAFNPPVSDALAEMKIQLIEHYPNKVVVNDSDLVVVGNKVSRSLPLIQFLIANQVKLYSAPEWLECFVLRKRSVIAVAGCHGKTSTSAMVAHLLSELGEDCGYLIAGALCSGKPAAHLGSSKYFVIEADEYDSAFFDKRPKFMHYWPSHLILGKIEFDHADIYDDFSDVLKQYKYLLRLLPEGANVVSQDLPLALCDQINAFSLKHHRVASNKIDYPLSIKGAFNQTNAALAIQLVHALGFKRGLCEQLICTFKGVKRRCEQVYNNKVEVLDDHAHHPTALNSLLDSFDHQRIHLVYHPATHTQKLDVHIAQTIKALNRVEFPMVLLPKAHALKTAVYEQASIRVLHEVALIDSIMQQVEEGDKIIFATPYQLTDLMTSLIEQLEKKYCELL